MADQQGRFIILRKVRYGEADLILQALSPKGEKASFMARAALKSKRRFGGGILEPLHFVQFTYKPGVGDGLSTLKEASLIDGFEGIRTDYDKLTFALKALETVGKVSLEGDSTSEYLFNLLGHALRAIEHTKDLPAVQLQFWLKFLLQQGVLTGDPWMSPFLKAPLSADADLAELSVQHRQRLPGLEMIVENYLKHAAV